MYHWDVLVTYHWDVVGCFIWDLFETWYRRTDGTSSLRLLETSSDIPLRSHENVPLRRSGDVPLRPRWVFHLRRTCDVAGTYKETSLWHRHDVSLLGWCYLFHTPSMDKVSMSCLFSFSGYQTKCDIEFLFRQLMTSGTLRFIFDHPPKQWPTARKRGKDRNTKNWISREWKELFRLNKKHFS